MEKAKKFEDLVLWQKSHALVLASYKISASFPRNEDFGLTSQFRRAAVSIPANIAEGFAKESVADKARYLNIAQASLEEVKYYLILINDLGYGDTREVKEQANEVGRILNAYRNSVLMEKANF
ncbi:MAG: four helix bundle protein [Puniceicoccaceae bacterium]